MHPKTIGTHLVRVLFVMSESFAPFVCKAQQVEAVKLEKHTTLRKPRLLWVCTIKNFHSQSNDVEF